jgi:hypothetical protein
MRDRPRGAEAEGPELELELDGQRAGMECRIADKIIYPASILRWVYIGGNIFLFMCVCLRLSELYKYLIINYTSHTHREQRGPEGPKLYR